MQPRIVGMLPKLPSHDIPRRIVVDPRQLAIPHQSVDLCVELGSRDKAILVLEHLRSRGREHVERRLVPAIEELDQLPRNDEVRFVGDAYLAGLDRKSTRLNSSHLVISYAVFCLKKKKTKR